ncbi:MAG: hypothetical protein E7327_08860 [Clostridiales bacterium]|nr:hypothetical protein [Clostridiales bacterium]
MTLEPHPTYSNRRVAYYDPAQVTELLLSAVPASGVNGWFEFEVWSVPSDEPFGSFIDNNDTFAFSQKPLEAGQHYSIDVFYYTPTEGGGAEEASGESIFAVDVYPLGETYGTTYTSGSSQYQLLTGYSPQTSPAELGLYERVKSGALGVSVLCTSCNERTDTEVSASNPGFTGTCANCGEARLAPPRLSSDTTVGSLKYYYRKITT